MKVVVVGGGTGTSVVLSGLKKFSDLNLSAVVVVSDSGGSTGRLRDEFGFLAVGDVRQCIAALATGKYEQKIRNLLLYRFGRGKGLKGHNLGNLIITALEDIEDSPGEAIQAASRIFQTKGQVFPISEQNVDLLIKFENGLVEIGEHILDEHEFGGQRIVSLETTPEAEIYSKAEKEIVKADAIVMGPGDLYGSLLANAVVKGFPQALNRSSAKFIYVVNLMTHYSQTHQMTAADHIQQVAQYCQREPDAVILNRGKISKELLEEYAKNEEYPVKDDLVADECSFEIIREDLVSSKVAKIDPRDQTPRSLLRHDQQKLAKVIYQLCSSL